MDRNQGRGIRLERFRATLDALQACVVSHVRPSGPVTFASVQEWVRVQFSEAACDWQVARALTEAIRAGFVDLSDDGATFTAGPVDPEEGR
jgi:hypothetical protein